MLSFSEACGYAFITVGGVIIIVTIVEDVATLGTGVFDDVITVPTGLVFIDLGQKMGVYVPAIIH